MPQCRERCNIRTIKNGSYLKFQKPILKDVHVHNVPPIASAVNAMNNKNNENKRVILEHFERDEEDDSCWGFLDCSLMCEKFKVDSKSDCLIYCKKDEVIIYSDQWEPKLSFPIKFSDIISYGIYNKNVWICYKNENGTELSLHYFDEINNTYKSHVQNIPVKTIFQSNDPSIFTVCTTDNKKIQYNIKNELESHETEWLYFLNINPDIAVFFNCTNDNQRYWVERYYSGHNHIFFESNQEINNVQCLIVDMKKNPHEILFTLNLDGKPRKTKKNHDVYSKEIFCAINTLKNFCIYVLDESYQSDNYKKKEKFFNFYELSLCPQGFEKYFENYINGEEKDEEVYTEFRYNSSRFNYKDFFRDHAYFLGVLTKISIGGLIGLGLYYVIQKFKLNIE